MMSLRFFMLDNSSMETDDACMSISKGTFEFYDDIFCKCIEIPKFEDAKNKLKEKEEVISVQYSLAQKSKDKIDYVGSTIQCRDKDYNKVFDALTQVGDKFLISDNFIGYRVNISHLIFNISLYYLYNIDNLSLSHIDTDL